MAAARCDAVSHLAAHVSPGAGFLEEAHVFHPRDGRDDAQPVVHGLIQEGDRRNGVRQDRVDAGLPHEREVFSHVRGFWKLVAFAVRREGSVRDAPDKEFFFVEMQELTPSLRAREGGTQIRLDHLRGD